MKVGERGQVTIPQEIRQRFGIGPNTAVEFRVVRGKIVLEKKPRQLNLRKWIGCCKGSLEELGFRTADEFLKDIRGR